MRKFCVILVLWILLVMAAPAFAAEAAEHAEPGKFDIFGKHPGEYIWTLIWFATLLVVLRKVAWKPILAGLQARQDYIAKQISDADDKAKEGKKVLAEYNDKLSNAQRECQIIIANGTKKAEKKSKEIIDQAQKEAQQIRLKAETDIERSRVEAVDDLWHQAGDILVKLGSDVLGKAMDEGDNKRLIDQAIDRFKTEESK